jgi:hypothetical protein
VLLAHAAALELSCKRRVGAQRRQRLAQLPGMRRLEPRALLRSASQLGGELGGLLVALNERALDFLILGERNAAER